MKIRTAAGCVVSRLGAMLLALCAFAPLPALAFGAEDCGVPRGATGCTANDTGIVSFALDPAFSGSDPTTCTAGSNVSFHLLVSVQTTANIRYDLGVLLAKDGKNPTVAAPTGAGACYVYAMPKTSPFTGDLPTGDGDACGDLQASAGTAQFNAGLVTMPCVAGAGGFLQIQGVALWDQNSNTTCNGPTDLQAGTGSKCKLTISTVPITVQTPSGTVTLIKDIVPNGDGGLFNLNAGGTSVSNVGDGGSVTRTGVTANSQVSLSETAGTGTSLSNYTSTLSCVRSDTGAAVSVNEENQVRMPNPATGIVCTFTNTRKAGTIQLRKTWVNAAINETATVTATGIFNSVAATLNSTANTASETDTGSAVTMYAGEVATLSETLSAPANYSSALACVNTANNASVTVTSNQVTMPSTPINIRCTYTNTRPSGTITLRKSWVNATVGHTAQLTATGIVNSATAALNSTASSPSDTDTGSSATMFAGEVATLAETVTPGSSYTAALACINTANNASVAVTNNQVTMPSTPINIRCTYTNTRINRSLTLVKQWANGKSGDQITVTTTGLTNNATVSSTSSGNNQTTGSAVSNVPGGTVTLPAETFNVGSQSNYTTTVSCTGATASGSAPGSTFTMPDNDVTCTYTNTRVSRSLTLVKQWVNGKSGDQITVTTTGLTNNATVSSTSSGSNQTTGSSVSNVPGATVTLPAETFNVGSQSNYTTTVSCTGATASGSTPGSTFTMPDNDVTCTYTNTRVNRNLTLVKQWVNGAAGDQISVTTQSSGNNASVSSTSSGNNQTTGSAASVVPGTVVTLPAETFNVGSQSNYTTTVSCSGATLSGSTPGSTFTMPDNDVTCTYTNTRANRSLTLVKQWVNGKSGDQVTVTTTGLTNNATVSSTSSGNNQTTGSAVSNVPGATVTLPAETFNVGSQSNYTTTVSCSGATASSSTPGPNTTFTMPDGNVVCTYTNTRVNRNLTLVKQWVNGANGDQISVTTQSSGNNASVSSTSTGNNQATGSAASVVPGTVVTLPAETFTPSGAASNYTVSVSCTGAALPPPGVPGASFTMPDGDVTCTYTNTRRSATLQLRKTWTNAVVNDTASLSAAGLANSAAAGFVSTANLASETDNGPVVTVYAGEVATLAETVNSPTNATYSSNLVCTGNFNTVVGNQLTISGDDDGATIVCTTTNGRTTPPFPGGGSAQPVPVGSPATLGLLAALIALLASAGLGRRQRVRHR